MDIYFYKVSPGINSLLQIVRAFSVDIFKNWFWLQEKRKMKRHRNIKRSYITIQSFKGRVRWQVINLRFMIWYILANADETNKRSNVIK